MKYEKSNQHCHLFLDQLYYRRNIGMVGMALNKIVFRQRQAIDKLRTFIKCVILKLLLDLSALETLSGMIQEKITTKNF